MKKIILIFGITMLFLSAKVRSPLEVVPYVELERYLGKWYEIAAYPTRFQKNCTASAANYSLNEDGTIKVFNSCRKLTPDGQFNSITGKAWVVDKETNAKLRVQFFWPFSGSYWIIGLDPDYKWAVVSHPSRKFLWILSRTPQMDDETYEFIIKLITLQGLDTSKLVKTIR